MQNPVMINGYSVVGRMPIFTAENRDLVRRGVKTQTRRVMTQQVGVMIDGGGQPYFNVPASDDWDVEFLRRDIRCSYGKPGDVRVMPEPLFNSGGKVAYKDDHVLVEWNGLIRRWQWKLDTLSSRFMPTALGRTLVRYTAIRAERLQDISEEDAIAEGITFVMDQHGEGYTYPGWSIRFPTAVVAYAALWDSINGKKHPWANNDWVWVIEWELFSEAADDKD